MQIITYNALLKFDSEADRQAILDILMAQRECFNRCSKVRFDLNSTSIRELHQSFYSDCREQRPEVPSQVVIKTIREVHAAFCSIKSNKHKLDDAPEKKRLSLRLDKRLYSCKGMTWRITTKNGRVPCKLLMFPKLEELYSKYDISDPLMFVRDDKIYLSIPFKIPTEPSKEHLALGIDLGQRRLAACSDGRIFKCSEYKKQRRKLRYLKKCLQAKKSASAKKHLKKVKRKEYYQANNLRHNLANQILQTNADLIAVENLKCIKKTKKENKYKNKNAASQVGYFELTRILTYKAGLLNKKVVKVNPSYTSVTDSTTGYRNGKRQGCRYYCKSGLVYDADINAAINIAKRTHRPVSYGPILDGQAVVNQPIVILKPHGV